MQTIIFSLKKSIPFLFLGMLSLIIVSCSSTQGVADRDGIYSSNTETNTEYANETELDSKNNYYKQYFKSKSSLYEELPEDDVIFTDVEAYSTTESLDDEGYVVTEDNTYEEGYGSWGSNDGDVTVTIYNTGWAGAGWGYNNWYGGWYGAGWGYGGWYRPWGFYNHWGNPYRGWNIGYWGGFYNPWYCAPVYYNPYFNNGHNGYYAANYNRGRRNSNYIAGRSAYNRGRSNATSSRRGYSNSEKARRSYRRGNSTYRGRPNSSSTRPNSGYSRPSNSRPKARPSNRRPKGNYGRPSTNTRPSYNTRPRTNPRPKVSRPSTSRPRSGSINRGGGSYRSSGGSRRSGRGGRG